MIATLAKQTSLKKLLLKTRYNKSGDFKYYFPSLLAVEKPPKPLHLNFLNFSFL
jgi:hypothetical protein